MSKGKKKTNKKFKINNKKIIGNILVVIILIYAFYAIYNLIKHPTDTFMVENGKLYSETTCTGYVIRNETVVKGENYKNGIVQIKSEGQKVAKNEAIFRYYSNSEEDLVKKIQELDVKIDEALQNENDIFSSDIKIIDNHISEKLEDLYDINNLQTIEEYKKEINTLVTKKAQIAGDLSPSGSYIRKLIEERNTYATQLNSGSEYITAPEAGIVSYRVDGLESVLTPDDFSNLNSKLLEELNLKTSQIIATSEESGKIIDNFNSYIVVVLPNEEVEEVEVGDTSITLRLSNSLEIPSTVKYISKEEDETLIVFEITKGVEELINYRKISLDIIWWSAEGLRIPNTSILSEGEINYVVRNRAGYLDKVPIKIMKQNKSYAIVKNYDTIELKEIGYEGERKTISLYDEILINPPNDI